MRWTDERPALLGRCRPREKEHMTLEIAYRLETRSTESGQVVWRTMKSRSPDQPGVAVRVAKKARPVARAEEREPPESFALNESKPTFHARTQELSLKACRQSRKKGSWTYWQGAKEAQVGSRELSKVRHLLNTRRQH